LAQGMHTIVAAYSGAPGYGPSVSPPLSQQVGATGRLTTTSLMSSQSPGSTNTPITFTGTVAPAFGPGTPTGTVTFTDTFNGVTTTLGTAPVNPATGQAMLTTSFPCSQEGNHTITAMYSGDAAFNGSASPPLVEQLFCD